MTDLADVLQPLATAHGLPNAHYTCRETYRRERDRLVFATWAGIGFGADVPEPGDAWPVELMGLPLLIVRDREGAIAVFQNTCRHRGMILVDAPRRLRGTLRCPYHSWCYGLDGRLVATPHVGGPGQNLHPEVRREELGLVRIRHAVWRDVVFVNVDGRAAPFEEHAAPAIASWADVDRPLHAGGPESRFALEVACNWKLAVENYCESYHLPWVHPGLNSYSRLEDHYNVEGDGFSGQGTRVYRTFEGADGARFADFPGLGPRWDRAAEYIALYPNVLFGVHRDHAFAILLLPDGPGRTTERVMLHYAAPDADADLRAANARLWRGVFEEDLFVVEGMQRGRAGIFFDGGRFAPGMDGPTHAFHAWVARRMSGG
jgi:choline monooxygenase